jgi:hypothetical protein
VPSEVEEVPEPEPEVWPEPLVLLEWVPAELLLDAEPEGDLGHAVNKTTNSVAGGAHKRFMAFLASFGPKQRA